VSEERLRAGVVAVNIPETAAGRVRAGVGVARSDHIFRPPLCSTTADCRRQKVLRSTGSSSAVRETRTTPYNYPGIPMVVGSEV
jgi:hypothetical protein